MKDGKATVYTIGIFDGANPKASVQDSKTSQENKFMQAVSSNYPNATAWDTHGTRAENSDYYKSATNAEELKKVFDGISQAITSETPYPTEIHKGYDETKSGYITFTDELGDFMQVDGFTEVVINGTPFTEASKTFNKETNTDTYEFTGKAKDLLITVQRAGADNPQKGDIVTVNIPASLIPLSHFKTVDGKLSVDNVKPIQVKYASSVKSAALDNLFTPEKVTGLKDYIEHNTTVVDGTKTVSFYANKWSGGALGDTVATFEPADTNRYYYFQKQTPIYTDKDCTQPAKNSLTDTGTYYYKDEFEEQGENGEAKPATAVIEFIATLPSLTALLLPTRTATFRLAWEPRVWPLSTSSTPPRAAWAATALVPRPTFSTPNGTTCPPRRLRRMSISIWATTARSALRMT